MVTFHIVDDALSLPKDAATAVFCGGVDANGRRGCKKTIWVSPSRKPELAGEDVVVRGEFSDLAWDVEGVPVVEVPGAGAFIPEWPEIVSGIVRGLPTAPDPQSSR